MKKYIYTNDNIEILGTLDIDIEFEQLEKTEEISSAISMEDYYDDKLDPQTYEDWTNFMLNIESILLELDFEIWKEDTGDNDISHYYYVRATDEEGNIIPNKMYKVRISNHQRTRARQIKDKQEITNIKSEYDIKVRFLGVIVNNKLFNSWDDAENKVEQELRKIRNNMRR